jgi:hypothetical protein
MVCVRVPYGNFVVAYPLLTGKLDSANDSRRESSEPATSIKVDFFF